MGTISAIIGTITLMFSFNIMEYAHIWLGLDIIGLILGFVAKKKEDKNASAGIALCILAGIFNLFYTILLVMYLRSM